MLTPFCGAGVRGGVKKFETLTKTPKKYIFLYPPSGIDYQTCEESAVVHKARSRERPQPSKGPGRTTSKPSLTTTPHQLLSILCHVPGSEKASPIWRVLEHSRSRSRSIPYPLQERSGVPSSRP